MEAWMNTLSPLVRAVKIVKSSTLSGEWIDYDHVFTYIAQGEADFILNGAKYGCKEGDVILMPPFLQHLIRTTSVVPLVQYIVHFDLYYDEVRSGWRTTTVLNEETRRIDEREMALAGALPVVHPRTADRIELTRRFLRLHKAYLEEGPYRQLLGKAFCLEMLAFFFQAQSDQAPREGHLTKSWGIIERAVGFIRENYADQSLDNRAIGAHAGVSNSHLSYLFKEQLAVTVHQYLTHVRIEQAKSLIVEGRRTLTAIAEETGFSGIHSFSRSFKAAVGLAPTQYYASHVRTRLDGDETGGA